MEAVPMEDGELALGPEEEQPAPVPPVNAARRVLIRKGIQDKFPLNAIVKLFITSVQAKYDSPWRRSNQRTGYGTGFVIKVKDEPMILTNWHVVADAVVIRTRRTSCATKFRGRLVCESPELDLALIAVDDKRFFRGLPVLEFMKHVGDDWALDALASCLPELDTPVLCAGYPLGADGLSVTRGVVSRILLQYYVRRGAPLLTVQIDAAINPGNSGGPVFGADGSVLGVARALRMRSQNIGYIISVPVVKLFLDTFERHGALIGVPVFPAASQKLESPSLRANLKLDKLSPGEDIKCRYVLNGDIGVLLTKVAPLGYLHDRISQYDVLLAIDGVPVASDGTVPLAPSRSTERLAFTHLISRLPLESKVSMCFWKPQEEKCVEIEVKLSELDRLVPILHNVDTLPRYLIRGGLVFVPLTVPWVTAVFSKVVVPADVSVRMMDFKEHSDEEVVMLSKVLSHDCNFGYQSFRRCILQSCNGVDVRNLRHLHELLEKADAEEARFVEFRTSQGHVLVLDRAECEKADVEIRETHAISEAYMLKNVGDRAESTESNDP